MLVATGLGGCVGHGAEPPPLTPQDVREPPTQSEGEIAGVVVGEDQLPMPGVNVGLRERPDVQTTTGLDGAFRFALLSPGSYHIVFQKLHHKAADLAVDVLAGEVTKVVVAMEMVAIARPYAAAFIDDAYIGFAFSGPTYLTGEPNATGDQKWRFSHDLDSAALTVVSATVWSRSTPLSAKYLSNAIAIDDQAGTSVRGTSPFTSRYERLDDAGTHQPLSAKPATLGVMVRVPALPCNPANPTSTDCTDDPPYGIVQIIFEQRIQVYSTVFFGEPAPPSFAGYPE
jgi:hypothetical protein